MHLCRLLSFTSTAVARVKMIGFDFIVCNRGHSKWVRTIVLLNQIVATFLNHFLLRKMPILLLAPFTIFENVLFELSF